MKLRSKIVEGGGWLFHNRRIKIKALSFGILALLLTVPSFLSIQYFIGGSHEMKISLIGILYAAGLALHAVVVCLALLFFAREQPRTIRSRRRIENGDLKKLY